MRREDVALVVAFASPDHDLQALVDEVNRVTGGAPLVGCTSAGEIASSEAADASIVVAAIGGDLGVRTAASVAVDGDLGAAAYAAATCADDASAANGHHIVLALSDGLAGDQADVVRGVYERVGATIPMVGGCAGDDLAMVRTHQFHGNQVLTDAVVCACITSPGPMGIGVQHGWERYGDPLTVTGVDGNTIVTLDDRPALDAYLERLDAPAGVDADAATFTRFAAVHPLGTGRRGGEEVRFVAGADLAQRTLACVAAVPLGGLVWPMTGTSASVLDAAAAASHEAVAGLDGHRPIGALAFDCIGRRGVLGGTGVHEELAAVARAIDDAPVAGFFTYGEFARTTGIRGFHNQTLVLLALS